VKDLGRDEIGRLVEQAKNLDRDALSELCVHLYPRIYRYVFYRVNNREDAEDLTSEVFVRMVKFLNTQKGSFHAWLYRIAANLVIDYYRRRARRKEISLGDEREEFLPSMEDHAEKTLLLEELRRALSELTEEQKQVITLKFMEGYDNSEIAEILSKSIGAVKALQFRGLAALRESLKKES